MNESGLEAVNWPVLRFGTPNCSMLKYDVADPLARASAKTLNEWRQMREYFLVDSSGMRHDLSDPRFVEESSGLGAKIFGMLGRKGRVKWHIETSGPLSVEEIRRLIVKDFDQYPTVWQAYEIDELRTQLESARSIRDVFRVFGEN